MIYKNLVKTIEEYYCLHDVCEFMERLQLIDFGLEPDDSGNALLICSKLEINPKVLRVESKKTS